MGRGEGEDVKKMEESEECMGVVREGEVSKKKEEGGMTSIVFASQKTKGSKEMGE